MADSTLKNASNEQLLDELYVRLSAGVPVMAGNRVVGPNRASREDGESVLDPTDLDAAAEKMPDVSEDADGPTRPDQAADQRVVRTKSTADRVYVIDETKKTRQWVTNPQVLESLGFTMADVTEITDDEMLNYQQGQALYRVVA